MASYTKLNSQEIDEIISLYRKNKVIKIEAMTTGISNSNYKVEFDDLSALILKISNDKDLNSFLEEEKILFLLKDLNFSYSVRPYQNLETKKYYFQKDDLLGATYPCLKGKVMPISDKVCFRVGEAIGMLHNVSQNKDLSNFEIRNYTQIGHDLITIKSFCQEEMETSKNSFSNFKNAFNKIFNPDLIEKILGLNFENRLIHGDLYYDNVLFDQEQNILGVLDFEQSGIGEKILDLGISISGTCLNQAGNIDLNYVKDFLQGYLSKESLCKQEEEYLYYFIHLGLFSIALWRIERFDIKNIDPGRKNSYEDLINKSLNFNQEVTYERFQSIFSN